MQGPAPPTPTPWFSEEEFWSSTYPFQFPPRTFRACRREVTSIIELSGCRAGAALDLCCGPGRHSVPLAQRGFEVTGVDGTSFLLDKAREYARSEDVEVEWLQEDMRSFRRSRRYDLAINLTISFGYFDDPDDNRAVLCNVFDSLKAGGVLVIDVAGKEVIARQFVEVGYLEEDGAGLAIQRRRVVDDWNRLEMQWLDLREGKCRCFKLRSWMYSGRELKELLADVGFSRVDLFGNFQGDEYGTEATRLVARARKE
ncbi:MAG TPA: class I SAM-dependent methyltransferase [Acidobacteriota bacterium]|nr:class I SAM-dependent methyltransferase [Acidobacteriota bacterium]